MLLELRKIHASQHEHTNLFKYASFMIVIHNVLGIMINPDNRGLF